MAHKKAGGSSKNGRDSQGQRRGTKRFSGQTVKAGNIIVRWDGIIPFLPRSTVWSPLNAKAGRAKRSVFMPREIH